MGLIMDVVPNHMCIASPDNHWWNDVLENGRSSPFAPFFDIDWHPPKSELHEKVLLPVLGEQYGRVLESQELRSSTTAGAFYAALLASAATRSAPRTILPLLEPIVADLRRSHPEDHPDVLEIESIVTATKHLPTRWDTEPEQVRERHARKGDRQAPPRRARRRQRRRPRRARAQPAPPSTASRATRAASTGWRRCSPIRPTASAYWGVAAEEINYRRFFDINDLAAIRVEQPKVLEAVHDKAVPAAARGQGDRPAHRSRRRSARSARAISQRPAARLRGAGGRRAARAPPGDRARLQTYVVVEKILTGDEVLPREWPVHGTTGYDFLNVVNGLFVDAGGARAHRAPSTSGCARAAASSTTSSTGRSG